ncbi:hypothetical protein [Streptomyces sp. NPDC002537]
MDPLRSALCAALAALAVGTAPAYATDGPVTMSGTVGLTPVTSTPGGHVRLRVAGCATDKGLAASPAFVSDARMAKDAAGLFTEATVRPATPPGSYPVRVECDGRRTEGRLTIVTEEQYRREVRAHDARADRQPRRGPVAPVPAGGGGTVAAPEPPGTPGLVLAGAGTLLAAGLIWHRRRAYAARR